MIYFITQEGKDFIKIGFTGDTHIEKRLTSLQTGNPYKLIVIKTIKGDINVEKDMHNRFKHLRSNGEWFSFTDELKEFISELDHTPYKTYDHLIDEIKILTDKNKKLWKANNVLETKYYKKANHANKDSISNTKLKKEIERLKKHNKILSEKNEDNVKRYNSLSNDKNDNKLRRSLAILTLKNNRLEEDIEKYRLKQHLVVKYGFKKSFIDEFRKKLELSALHTNVLKTINNIINNIMQEER